MKKIINFLEKFYNGYAASTALACLALSVPGGMLFGYWGLIIPIAMVPLIGIGFLISLFLVMCAGNWIK